MSATDVSGQPSAGWDESQCTAALAQLEQLQSQIDELRLAIPRIIEPFHQPFTPSTFKSYAQGATSSQNGIKALGEQWKSHQIQNIFEHVKKSYSANADLSEGVSVSSHGWRERERNKTASKPSGHGASVQVSEAALNDEDVTRIVDDFRKRHPSIKIDTQDDNHNISVWFVSGSVKLMFHVRIERDADRGHKLSAECLGSTGLSQAITRCIALQSQTNDLENLLGMIAAYKTVTPTLCAGCDKRFDHTMLPPVARRRKQNATIDGTLHTMWQAFHEGCIE